MTFIIAKPWAVYNEIEEYAADWLENLIALGEIAPGIVDRRSIVDVRPDDYRGFRQAHFFAGVAVWSYALRGAGVSDDTALWTGSCPCQPFSAAGAGVGMDDERHLWPHWFHLIRNQRPPRIYGEQVASKDGLGWLDLVSADLEGEGYAIWAVDTCSAGSGAPHIRQRLRFCADDMGSAAGGLQHASGNGWEQRRAEPGERGLERGRASGGVADADRSRGPSWLPESSQREARIAEVNDDGGNRLFRPGEGGSGAQCLGQRTRSLRPVATTSGVEWLADAGCVGVQSQHGPHETSGAPGPTGGEARERERRRAADRAGGPSLGLADDKLQQRQIASGLGDDPRGWQQEPAAASGLRRNSRPGPTNGFWRDADWLFCRDGKWRPVEPGTFPLVDGSAFKLGSGSPFEGKSRQGMLKGYGNAIDAQATIDFIEATLESDPVGEVVDEDDLL